MSASERKKLFFLPRCSYDCCYVLCLIPSFCTLVGRSTSRTNKKKWHALPTENDVPQQTYFTFIIIIIACTETRDFSIGRKCVIRLSLHITIWAWSRVCERICRFQRTSTSTVYCGKIPICSLSNDSEGKMCMCHGWERTFWEAGGTGKESIWHSKLLWRDAIIYK